MESVTSMKTVEFGSDPAGLSGKYAIVGIGETETGKLPGTTVLTLHLEAIRRALADSGLEKGAIDGLITNQPINDPFRSYANYLAASGGLDVTFATDLGLGGATPVAMAQMAVMAINAGLCSTVVCVHGRNRATASTQPYRGEIRDGNEDYEEPFGLLGAPAAHAAVAQRHMFEYGTTSEQLGAVAVAMRRHAAMNAAATMREPITIADHQASRWIVKPLHILDCCLVSDGGGAFIVTSAPRARDLPKPPTYILGMGQHHPQNNLMEAKTITTGGGQVSAAMAYGMAGLRPENMDFAQIYDCFTITVLVTLEDYGFCPKGEGGRWVEGGRIEVGGELPVNTHGGLLSGAHVEGMLHVTEAVKQLRGGSVEPERQVEGAKLGIVSGHGGIFATHSTLILGNEAV
jgi:acetyl-CoA acetyltransferase